MNVNTKIFDQCFQMPTDKQMRLVGKIEKSRVCPKFTGSNRRDASKYIEKYLDVYNNRPTDKQYKLIDKMRDYGCPKFNGKTFKSASTYIDENMEFFREQQQFMQ